MREETNSANKTLSFVLSILCLTLAAAPSYAALTPPELLITTAGGSITIDSLGNQVVTCTCPGTAKVTAPGNINWVGLIGGVGVSVTGTSYRAAVPSFPSIDLGVITLGAKHERCVWNRDTSRIDLDSP
jgi:hypothetical protein